MARPSFRRFILEIVLDESFFEVRGKRKIFRYREKSEFIAFRARTARNARKLAPKKLERFMKRESLPRLSLVGCRLYEKRFFPASAGGYFENTRTAVSPH